MNSNNDWTTVPSAAPRFGRAAAAAAPDHAPSAFGRGASAPDHAPPAFGRAAASAAPSAAPMRPAFGTASGFARGDAPSAFGRAPPNERAMARQAESARFAEEQHRKQEAEAAAARKEAEALNFASAASYPVLGGGGPKAQPKATMNYKRTVEEMVERQKELEAEEAVAEASNWWDSAEPRKVQSRYIRQRNTEELDDDFLSADEDEEKEDVGEFNAEIVSDRRRGDKGVW